MAEPLQAYPLSWPTGWKRTPATTRKSGHFNKKATLPGNSYASATNLTVADGVERIIEQMSKLGVDRQDLIISTNVRTRLDGLPRSGEAQPVDPGAACYWKPGAGKPMRSMAIDQYTTVADNLAAIAATLDALRAIERHGGAEILDRAFTGFSALPAKASSPWRDVLIVSESATIDAVDAVFKQEAKRYHPDSGVEPDEEKFRLLVQAREDARKELGAAL